MRLSRILQAVLDEGEIEREDLFRPRILKRVLRHHQTVVLLMHELAPVSFSEIGRVMNRESSSIRYTYDQATRRRAEDPRFERSIKKNIGHAHCRRHVRAGI